MLTETFEIEVTKYVYCCCCPVSFQLNYLLLLGWSLDGERERFTVDEMTKLFSLDRVTKAPASFDPQKLMSFQSDRMAELPADEKLAMVLPYAEKAGWTKSPNDIQRIRSVMIAAGERIRVAGDILDFDFCFVADDELQYDEKAMQKRITGAQDAAELLAGFAETIPAIAPFDAESIESALKSFCEARSIGIGQIIHALRVATTGTAIGFGMFETLAILGPQSTRNRIARALQIANSR